MKILVVGSTGMLGRTLKDFLTISGYECDSLDRRHVDLSKCGFRELEDIISTSGCDVLVNCAGLIKQREGTTMSDLISVNSVLPHRLSDICEVQKIKMIHITTDCVFDGKQGLYTELHQHSSLDSYGMTKSLGEPPSATVIRTSIIGEERNNKLSLLEWVRKNRNGKIDGYINHQWNGVTCLQLSKIVKEVLDGDLFWSGTRHIFSPKPVSKYELIEMINEIYKLDIKIAKKSAEEEIDRTLNTSFRLPNFEIKGLYEQIEDTKEFHNSLKSLLPTEEREHITLSK